MVKSLNLKKMNRFDLLNVALALLLGYALAMFFMILAGGSQDMLRDAITLGAVFGSILVSLTAVFIALDGRRLSEKARVIMFPESEKKDWDYLILVVENIGPGSAYDVKFTMEDTKVGQLVDLTRIPFLTHGVRYLPPGKRIQIPLTPRDNNTLKGSIKGIITYSDGYEGERTEPVNINLEAFGRLT